MSVLWQEIMKRILIMCKKQVRQEADVIFSKAKGTAIRFPQDANQALDQEEKLVTEVTSDDVRTELCLQALHAEDVLQQQQNQDYAGLLQHLTGVVQENTAITKKGLKNLDLIKSSAGPDTDRRSTKREEELSREVRRKNDARAKCEAQVLTWNRINPGHQKDSSYLVSYTAKLRNCKHQLCNQIPPEILLFQI